MGEIKTANEYEKNIILMNDTEKYKQPTLPQKLTKTQLVKIMR